MHRLAARVRKIERKYARLDLSVFTGDEHVELTRLLLCKQFGLNVPWNAAYFLTNYRPAYAEFCRLPTLSAGRVREWLENHALAAIENHAPTAPLSDVATSTMRKLCDQLGVWDHFARCPDWVWFFRTAAAIR